MHKVIVLLGLSALTACASSQKAAHLDLIYEKSAKTDRPDRNPVIVIPGILGSRLKDQETETLVWGAFTSGAADPQDPAGARLISLPIEGDKDLSELRDDVQPDGVLESIRVDILGIPIELQAYAGIMSTLGAGGYRDESFGLAGAVDYGEDHYTCFQYAFDWRRSNAENAAVLFNYIKQRRTEVQAAYKKNFGMDDADVKFDIVAHSMGGLVTRYMLRYGDQQLPSDGSLPALTWAGAEYVNKVILVGTPNGGSADALVDLVKGRDIGRPFLPYYQPALMGTFVSVYELLPRARHGHVFFDGDKSKPVEDLFDPALWRRMQWGLVDPRQDEVLKNLMPLVTDPKERRDTADTLLSLILLEAKSFAGALDVPAKTPEGLEIILVAGDATPTSKDISIDSTTGELSVVGFGDGDGTVLRSSVLMDEREGGEWQPYVQSPIDYQTVMFLPDDHLGLTKSIVFQDNVLYWLLEAPPKD
jgi:pimeloyl-ACP methyl ester carboxylesterase